MLKQEGSPRELRWQYPLQGNAQWLSWSQPYSQHQEVSLSTQEPNWFICCQGKRRPSAPPLYKGHITLLPLIAFQLSTFLSSDRAQRSSSIAQGLAAHSPHSSFWAGNQMPRPQCASGTSGVHKLQSRQTYCHSLATCCLTHQLQTWWL